MTHRYTLTAKQAVSPGTMNWICPDTAFSDTPDSNQVKLNSLQAVLMANLASKLSTQLNTISTGPSDKLLFLKNNTHDVSNKIQSKKSFYLKTSVKLSKFSTVVML